MKPEDIDEILAGDTPIEPSREFATVVMAAVRREATQPRPLEFPWLRALPGMLALLAAVVAMFWNGVASLSEPAESALVEQQLRQWLQLAIDSGMLWLVLVLALCFVSVAAPMAVVRSRTHLA